MPEHSLPFAPSGQARRWQYSPFHVESQKHVALLALAPTLILRRPSTTHIPWLLQFW
jgi:hypothetical protein